MHDISDGGLAVAVAEMALTGNLGAHVDTFGPAVDKCSTLEAFLFGEDQGRFVATVRTIEVAQAVCKRVEDAGVGFSYIGSVTSKPEIQFGDNPGYSGHVATIPLADLRAANERFFREWMEA